MELIQACLVASPSSVRSITFPSGGSPMPKSEYAFGFTVKVIGTDSVMRFRMHQRNCPSIQR